MSCFASKCSQSGLKKLFLVIYDLYFSFFRVKPSAWASAASSACSPCSSSRTTMRRKKARQRWRRNRRHHLLQRRAAKTESVVLPETNSFWNPLEYFNLGLTGCARRTGVCRGPCSPITERPLYFKGPVKLSEVLWRGFYLLFDCSLRS